MRSASVRHGRETLLPPTSTEVPGGEVVVVVGQPGAQLTAFSLALAGRLRLSTGEVVREDRNDVADLRCAVALVDVPEVSEPERGVPVRTVVAEELAFAGLPTSRARATEWLAARGLKEWASRRIEELPAEHRVELLADLAALRPGVTHLVIGYPERHGGSPVEWIGVAERHARNGLGVVLTVSHATATNHDATCVLGDPDTASTPEPQPEPEPEPVPEPPMPEPLVEDEAIEQVAAEPPPPETERPAAVEGTDEGVDR